MYSGLSKIHLGAKNEDHSITRTMVWKHIWCVSFINIRVKKTISPIDSNRFAGTLGNPIDCNASKKKKKNRDLKNVLRRSDNP